MYRTTHTHTHSHTHKLDTYADADADADADTGTGTDTDTDKDLIRLIPLVVVAIFQLNHIRVSQLFHYLQLSILASHRRWSEGGEGAGGGLRRGGG